MSVVISRVIGSVSVGSLIEREYLIDFFSERNQIPISQSYCLQASTMIELYPEKEIKGCDHRWKLTVDFNRVKVDVVRCG